MKKLTSVLMATVLALSLCACAGTTKQGTARIKCPACGFEFDSPKQ